jgi:hypothetical protein
MNLRSGRYAQTPPKFRSGLQNFGETETCRTPHHSRYVSRQSVEQLVMMRASEARHLRFLINLSIVLQKFGAQEARSRRLITLRHFGAPPKCRRMCIELRASTRMLSFLHGDDPSTNFLRRAGIKSVARFLLSYELRQTWIVRSGEQKC